MQESCEISEGTISERCTVAINILPKYSAHFISTQRVPRDRSRRSESGLSDRSCIVHGKVYARTREQLEQMVNTVTERWAWLCDQTNVRLHPCVKAGWWPITENEVVSNLGSEDNYQYRALSGATV